jgi:hypothetical protein
VVSLGSLHVPEGGLDWEVWRGMGSWFTWISAVRFCMMAQMSLVSLGVKLGASVPGVVGAVWSSMVVVLVVVFGL